eukprot:TRINITY_DN17420_c0_g5_i1.p1 TRINITY_DN17420_c0_g5~~TRINITY_DN17420_c0_g5_i1.p1  ORF type:complete len:295 (-),score=23.95 TRINITY_DN17420_c0_g5_i1:434-1318(-)
MGLSPSKKKSSTAAQVGKISSRKSSLIRTPPIRQLVVWQGRSIEFEDLPEGTRKDVVLNPERFEFIREYLPTVLRFSEAWSLLYSPAFHGVSLRTMYKLLENADVPSIVIMQESVTPSGVAPIFGGFAPEAWRQGRYYYGDNSCFAFTFRQATKSSATRRRSSISKVLSQKTGEGFEAWDWLQPDSGPMHSNSQHLMMGVASAPAWEVQDDFLRCRCGSGASPHADMARDGFRIQEPLASAQDVCLTAFEVWIACDDPPPRPARSSMSRSRRMKQRLSHTLSSMVSKPRSKDKE